MARRDGRAAGRLRGIDAARAIAIVGMVMVHVGPREGAGLGFTLYGLTYGRASLLFVVLAGVGVSLLAGDGGRSRVRDARLRLLFRAAVLFPLGLWLQTLDTPVAVILHYYAVYFLIAATAVRLPDRALATAAVVLAVVGPLVSIASEQLVPGWWEGDIAATLREPGRLLRELLLTGYYPALTWAPPLLAGMWVGHRDLRAPRVQRALLAGGGGVAAFAYVGAWALGRVVVGGAPEVDTPGFLLTAGGHTDMPLGIIGATAVALAVLGAALLICTRLPRLTWPLAATGQLALSIYVGHLLVLHVAPELLVRDGLAGAAFMVARFAVVTVVGATLWRAALPRGPLEAVLHAPWALAGNASTSPSLFIAFQLTLLASMPYRPRYQRGRQRGRRHGRSTDRREHRRYGGCSRGDGGHRQQRDRHG